MICPKCSCELTNDSTFCPNCGTPVAPQPAAEEPTVINEEPAAQPAYAQQPYQQPQGGYAPPVYGAAPQPYAAPAPVAARKDYPEGYKIKRKYVAVILGWSLGIFGAHNFYLGNNSKAIAQVLLSTVGSLLFGLGPIAAAIWAIIETVQILTENIDRDANGFKIQTFEEALVKARMEAELDK